MRALLVAPVLSLLALAAPAAAEPYEGGCGYDAPTFLAPVRNPGAPSTRTVVVYLAIAVEDADVTCEVQVNGVPQVVLGPVHVTGAGAGVAVGTVTTTHPFDDVQLCMRLDDVRECYYTTSMGFPPQELWELVDAALKPTDPVCPYVGDVYVAYEWVYDCPGR